MNQSDSRLNEKIVQLKSFDINYNTLGGSAHAAMASPVAIVPYYVYAIVEKFPVWVMPRHRNAPPSPYGGRVGARGEIIT